MLALALALLLAQAAPPAPPAPPSPAPQAKPAPPPRPPRPAAPPRAGAADEVEEPVLRGFDRPSGKRFTADLDEVEVDDALRQIAEAADWSIVFPKGSHGTISARFKDVPVEDALRAVLAQADLTASREGAVITIRGRSAFGRLRLPGLSVDVERRAEEALRKAEREMARAERDVERAERAERGGKNQNDKVVHGDVVVHANSPARDIVAIRGSVKVEAGAEARDVVAVLGSVVLEPGARAREVVAIGGDVKLGAGAEIDKDVVSVGGEIVRDAGAEIGGEEVSVGVPALSGLAGLVGSKGAFGEKPHPVFVVGQVLAKFLVFFALGLAALSLFPRRVDAVAASFSASPWRSVFTGLLGVVALPILTVLLVATVIGIPLVAVLAVLVLAAGILGFTALSLHIGRALPFRASRGTILRLAVGTAIVVLVTAIPFLGGMACVAAALLTFGAALRSRLGTQAPVLETTLPPAAPPPAAPA